MSMHTSLKRILAALCAGFLLATSTLPAQAAMVGSEQIVSEARADFNRAELVQLLERDQVREQLQALGVDPEAAQERVARMTDAEIAQLQGRLDELPAGQDALGVILVVFLVFVITDIIGATDIFPFIDSVD